MAAPTRTGSGLLERLIDRLERARVAMLDPHIAVALAVARGADRECDR